MQNENVGANWFENILPLTGPGGHMGLSPRKQARVDEDADNSPSLRVLGDSSVLLLTQSPGWILASPTDVTHRFREGAPYWGQSAVSLAGLDQTPGVSGKRL